MAMILIRTSSKRWGIWGSLWEIQGIRGTRGTSLSSSRL